MAAAFGGSQSAGGPMALSDLLDPSRLTQFEVSFHTVYLLHIIYSHAIK